MFATYGAYFAVKALTKPIYGIALTVFYFDQRIRKEGFDIEWMMQQAGMLALPALVRIRAFSRCLRSDSSPRDSMIL